MFLNIVTNNVILAKIKTIPYFETDLGSSFRRKGKRGAQDSIDYGTPFVENYYMQNRRLLMKSGSIGTINVYTDYSIDRNSIHIYKDGVLYDFIFNHNDLSVSGNIQSYLGSLLKKIGKDTKEKVPSIIADKKPDEANIVEVNKEKIMLAPGRVTWEDLQAYKKNKKK